MQLSLQAFEPPLPHRQAIYSAPERAQGGPYVCSRDVRPRGYLQYEHLFPSVHRLQHRSPFVRRVASALLLIRSFLLLEDDYDVDWEVDQDKRTGFVGSDANGQASIALRPELGGPEGGGHPHRMALQSRLGDRRPGEGTPREMVCLSPVPRGDRGRSRPVSAGRG
jgi:hypothetical protein